MKSFFASLAAVALVASTVSAQTFTINSISNVVVCRPSLLTWTGGVAPYFLSILPAGQPAAPALVDLGQQNGNSVTWLVNLGEGTAGFLNLKDSTGNLAQSASFTVLAGSNSSCVTQTLSQSQGTPAATQANPASNTAASTTGSTSTGSGSSSASSTKATGSTTGTPAPTSAAISNYAGAGAIAVIGSAFLALAL